MNILIVTGHPAQVHNFKYFKSDLEKTGHQIYWLATNKDVSEYLLNHYAIEYSTLNKPGNSFFSKVLVFVKNTLVAYKFIKKYKIEIAVSRVSPYISIACFLLCKPHIGLTDTETAGIYDRIFSRFLSVLLTAKSFQRTLRKDQIRFNGNIELFYLYPKRFNPLSKSQVAGLLNIHKDEPYIIMRFVSWGAYHDKGLSGFNDANKMKAVEEFSAYAKVFISSENELPVELEPYKIKIPPEKMHDVLAHATLFFGESATMASECAVLGTQAIFLNENWFGSTDEEKDFGLLYSYKQSLTDQDKAIKKGVDLLKNSSLKVEIQIKRSSFLENKIDVTAFLVWFIENYPESFRIMKENPDYQNKFQ